MLSFLNGLSCCSQIGLKWKIFWYSFRRKNEKKAFLKSYHVKHKWYFMQNWFCVHEIQSRLKLSKSLELFSKTTLKNLSFETNLESVAQSVEEWEQFKEKQFSQHLFNFFIFFHFAYFDLKLKRNKRIIFFRENPWNFPAIICKLIFSKSFFQNFASPSSFCAMPSSYVTVQNNHTVISTPTCFLYHSIR